MLVVALCSHRCGIVNHVPIVGVEDLVVVVALLIIQVALNMYVTLLVMGCWLHVVVQVVVVAQLHIQIHNLKILKKEEVVLLGIEEEDVYIEEVGKDNGN